MKQVKLLLMMAVFCFTAMTTYATQAASTDLSTLTNPTTETISAKKGLVAKFTAKVAEVKTNLIAKKYAKPGVDFSDPVKKWLWYALFSWLGGILLYIISAIVGVGSVTAGATTGLGLAGILGLIGGILSLAGTVFFVIWLIKKFG